jgi:HTH-type transcriptional regulator/antitoxin HigA
MTGTFDRSAYTDLLSQVTPKVIETEEEYEATLAAVESLVFNRNRTTEQTALCKLLVLLVEAYEEEHCSPNLIVKVHSPPGRQPCLSGLR